ncbi:MAG: MFS transporter, partial [Pseudomonadales bacterium]|nr:MFS transporter [Pseudomonadales bacterium]
MFAATASGSTRAPFLLEMATDFTVGLPAIANLFGLTAVVWGISSFLSGKAADRWGRHVFLVISPAGLATSLVATVIVEQYWSLVICIGFVSIFCGSFSTASMTEVSLRTGNQQRGRALGWVMSGQSLTLLIGIPLAAWIGGWIGWRGVQISVASVAILAGILLAINANYYSKQQRGINKRGSSKQLTLRQALTAPVVRLFSSLIMERIGFGLATF